MFKFLYFKRFPLGIFNIKFFYDNDIMMSPRRRKLLSKNYVKNLLCGRFNNFPTTREGTVNRKSQWLVKLRRDSITLPKLSRTDPTIQFFAES